jgi:hypothetical protein
VVGDEQNGKAKGQLQVAVTSGVLSGRAKAEGEEVKCRIGGRRSKSATWIFSWRAGRVSMVSALRAPARGVRESRWVEGYEVVLRVGFGR